MHEAQMLNVRQDDKANRSLIIWHQHLQFVIVKDVIFSHQTNCVICQEINSYLFQKMFGFFSFFLDSLFLGFVNQAWVIRKSYLIVIILLDLLFTLHFINTDLIFYNSQIHNALITKLNSNIDYVFNKLILS